MGRLTFVFPLPTIKYTINYQQTFCLSFTDCSMCFLFSSRFLLEGEKRRNDWRNEATTTAFICTRTKKSGWRGAKKWNRQAGRQRDGQRDKPRWTNGKTVSQTDRQKNRQTDRQTDRPMYVSMRQAITHHLYQWKGSKMLNLWSSSLFEWWRARTFNSSLFWLSWLFFKSFICLKDTRACISGKNIWLGNLCFSNTCNCQSRVYAVIFWSNLCITVKRIHMIKATKSYFPCKSANNFIFSSCDSCINLSSSSCFWNNLTKQTSERGCSKLY